mgnify:FL=1
MKQSCTDCNWGPAYTEQHAGKCGQRISTAMFDDIANDCLYWSYMPGADVEYKEDGTVSN